MNDSPSSAIHREISLYADDTVIYYPSDNAHDTENRINSDLERLCKWFHNNLLTLNISKCKFIIYDSSCKLTKFKNVPISVNDIPLSKTNSFKYLGMTIQQNLTWSEHTDNISKKVNQRLGLIRRMKYLLPFQARLTLYNILVLPLFDCSDIIWGDKNNSSLINHLQVLQHNAARLILDLPRESSATEALHILEWKPLSLRRKYHRCTSMFKCLNQLVDFDFKLVKNSRRHSYRTRQINDYHLFRPPTNWGKQQFAYHAVSKWNSLSNKLKQTIVSKFLNSN